MFKYLNSKREDKKKIEDEKRQKKVDQCIDDVVDNGSIKDLIDIGSRIK